MWSLGDAVRPRLPRYVDDLGEVQEVKLGGIRIGTDYERFREKARAYLCEHADHIALQKLRRNLPLTVTDLDELDRMLQEAGAGDPADIERARLEGGGLGPFVRSLVGLDRAAAADALSRFSAGRTLSADQLDFVGHVVEHLTANGTMDPGLRYEPPFTSVAAGGPESLLPDADVEVLIAVIQEVQDNACPGASRVRRSGPGRLAQPRSAPEASIAADHGWVRLSQEAETPAVAGGPEMGDPGFEPG